MTHYFREQIPIGYNIIRVGLHITLNPIKQLRCYYFSIIHKSPRQLSSRFFKVFIPLNILTIPSTYDNLTRLQVVYIKSISIYFVLSDYIVWQLLQCFRCIKSQIFRCYLISQQYFIRRNESFECLIDALISQPYT